MRRLLPRAALASIAVLAAAAPAGKAASAPAGLMDARRALAAAVSSHDAAAAARLVHFPLALDVYGMGPSLTEAVFVRDKRYFKGIFGDGDSGIVHCLEGAAAEKQASPDHAGAPWIVDCDGNEYYFGEYGGHWLMGAYANINE